MQRVLAPVVAVILIVIGILAQQDPYRLRDPGHAADQVALDHRDSVYTHISWVTSESHNYAQLRFYDRVEGGVCLEPRWDRLADLAPDTLAHLAMPEDRPIDTVPAGRWWPEGRPKPNMGTVSNTKYICLYPTAVLLNQRLMREANGDPRKAAPNILIVGLGSGVGVSLFAHHFPEASITVVDIDAKVLEMVTDHYPLIDWLANEAPPTSDGRKRLRLVACDARKAVIYPDLHGSERPFDVVVLDAYTSGSTIPPHLMTREFYQEIDEAMTDDGIVLSNIIGSYRGPQRQLLGGAMRSMQAAGLEHVHNFPVYYYLNGQTKPVLDLEQQANSRNNVVLASREPLDPGANPAGWEAMEAFVPYHDLPVGRFRSAWAILFSRDGGMSMAASLLDADERPIDAGLVNALRKVYGNQPEDMRYQVAVEDDDLIRRTIAAVRSRASDQGRDIPGGWDRDDARRMHVVLVDWVVHARRTWAAGVSLAAEKASITRYLHSGRNLVGPPEDERDGADGNWVIKGVPLFTDGTPNADIYNH